MNEVAETTEEGTIAKPDDPEVIQAYVSSLQSSHPYDFRKFARDNPALSPEGLEKVLESVCQADPCLSQTKHLGDAMSYFVQASYDEGHNNFSLTAPFSINMARGLRGRPDNPLKLYYGGGITKNFGVDSIWCEFRVMCDSGVNDGNRAENSVFIYVGDAYNNVGANSRGCLFEFNDAQPNIGSGAWGSEFIIRNRFHVPDRFNWSCGYQMPTSCRFVAMNDDTFQALSKIYGQSNIIEYRPGK